MVDLASSCTPKSRSFSVDDSLHVSCGDRLTFRHIDLAAQLNTGFPCPCNNSACGFQLRIGYYPGDRGRLVSIQMGVVLASSSLNGWLYSHDCGQKARGSSGR